MSRSDKNCLWGLAAGIAPITMLLGPLITRPLGGTENMSVAVGFVFTAIFLSIYIPLVAQIETREPGQTTALSPEPTPLTPSKGAKEKGMDVSDLDKERAKRLEELKTAAEDPDNPLDEITVGAQEREIEADYQRKLAERTR